MTYDVSTFGEAQIRLTVTKGDRLSTCQNLRLTPACSEANVAGLLAQLGNRAAYASVVPATDLGIRFMQEYRSVGVDLSHVIRTADDRMALYFMEPGDAPMPGRVTYDRMHTPFREITPETFDWDSLLDTRLLFVTGITAALTQSTAATVTHAVREAHARGVRVALDVNYRGMLWTPQQARDVLEPLLPMVDVLFCSRTDGNKVFGIKGKGIEVTRELRVRHGLDEVVSTDGVRGVYHCGPGGEEVLAVESVPVTDRPGAGDSFVGGCLHGYLAGDLSAGIGYGLRTSKFALTHHGDLTHISPSELDIPTTTDILR